MSAFCAVWMDTSDVVLSQNWRAKGWTRWQWICRQSFERLLLKACAACRHEHADHGIQPGNNGCELQCSHIPSPDHPPSRLLEFSNDACALGFGDTVAGSCLKSGSVFCRDGMLGVCNACDSLQTRDCSAECTEYLRTGYLLSHCAYGGYFGE